MFGTTVVHFLAVEATTLALTARLMYEYRYKYHGSKHMFNVKLKMRNSSLDVSLIQILQGFASNQIYRLTS